MTMKCVLNKIIIKFSAAFYQCSVGKHRKIFWMWKLHQRSLHLFESISHLSFAVVVEVLSLFCFSFQMFIVASFYSFLIPSLILKYLVLRLQVDFDSLLR